MARRQASCNKTTRITAKSSSKPLVRRHSKRLQRQQRDLPTLLQDLSCVTSDQVSGEEDSSLILTQSGSDISLQDISRDCSSKVDIHQYSENSSNSEDMLSVLQPQILPFAGCQGPAGGCQAGITMPWPVMDASITNETIIAHTDFTTTSEIAKRRMQSKRSKRQRQIRSNSVVSSVSSRSSVASPDIGSCSHESTQLPLTCYSVNGSNANTTMSSLSTSSSSNSVAIQPTVARQDASTLPQAPIPMYIQQPQSTTLSVASSGYSSTGLSHPVLSQLQQELSYRFIKDQGLVQDGAVTSSDSATTVLPKGTAELGSSQSAFQKKVISKWCCAHISIARFIQTHRKQQQQQQAAAVATAEAIAQETLKAAEQEHKNSQHQQFVPSNMVCYSHPLATSSAAAGAGLLWQQHQQTLQQWQQQSQHPPQLMPTNTSQYQLLQTVPLQAEVTAIAHQQQQQHTNSSNTVLRPMSVPMGHHVILPQGLVPMSSVLQAAPANNTLPVSHPYQVIGQMSSQQVQQQPQLSSTGSTTAMGTLLINNNHSFITPFQPAFITSSWVK